VEAWLENRLARSSADPVPVGSRLTATAPSFTGYELVDWEPFPIMPAPDTTEDRALEALANGNWWGHWDLVKWTESYNVRDAIRRLEAKGWCFERGWSVSPRSGKEFRRWRLTAGSASGTGIGSRGCDGVNRSPRHPFGAQ